MSLVFSHLPLSLNRTLHSLSCLTFSLFFSLSLSSHPRPSRPFQEHVVCLFPFTLFTLIFATVHHRLHHWNTFGRRKYACFSQNTKKQTTKQTEMKDEMQRRQWRGNEEGMREMREELSLCLRKKINRETKCSKRKNETNLLCSTLWETSSSWSCRQETKRSIHVNPWSIVDDQERDYCVITMMITRNQSLWWSCLSPSRIPFQLQFLFYYICQWDMKQALIQWQREKHLRLSLSLFIVQQKLFVPRCCQKFFALLHKMYFRTWNILDNWTTDFFVSSHSTTLPGIDWS